MQKGSIDPFREVGHENGDESDDRWSNLTLLSKQQNQRNLKLAKSNISGVTGVRQVGDKWVAYITVEYTQRYLGTFSTIEQAAGVRKAAELYYGFHQNHGQSK